MQLFANGDIFIGEWGVFGAEVFLCYSRFFVKGDFVIGRVDCMYKLNWRCENINVKYIFVQMYNMYKIIN